MAKQVLPVNFTDDLLAESMDGKRKYRIIDNGDGTISLEDVSEYLQMGSTFGAGQVNSTNQAVNESVDKDKILKTLEEVSASTDGDAVVGRGAVAELNQNIADNTKYIRLQSRNSKETNGRHLFYGEMSGNGPKIGYDYCADPNNATARTDYVKVYFDGENFYAEGKKAGADAVLKKLGEVQRTYLGSVGTGATTVDCTKIDGYKDLTVNNFALIPTSINAKNRVAPETSHNNSNHNVTETLGSMSYNQNTGKLTIPKLSLNCRRDYLDMWYTTIDALVTYDLYCFHN